MTRALIVLALGVGCAFGNLVFGDLIYQEGERCEYVLGFVVCQDQDNCVGECSEIVFDKKEYVCLPAGDQYHCVSDDSELVVGTVYGGLQGGL